VKPQALFRQTKEEPVILPHILHNTPSEDLSDELIQRVLTGHVTDKTNFVTKRRHRATETETKPVCCFLTAQRNLRACV
jgi:adenylate kinase family enzyme